MSEAVPDLQAALRSAELIFSQLQRSAEQEAAAFTKTASEYATRSGESRAWSEARDAALRQADAATRKAKLCYAQAKSAREGSLLSIFNTSEPMPGSQQLRPLFDQCATFGLVRFVSADDAELFAQAYRYPAKQ